MTRRLWRIARLAALIVLAGPPAGRAAEGMWTFDAVPTQRLDQALGVKVDRAWLDHLRLASLRLSSGCSAALVSRDGLALTNQHCVLDCVQSLSTQAHDYVADGFLTDSRDEERACPGLRAEVLVAIEDVTAQIDAAGAGKLGVDFVFARQGAIGKAERAACGGERAVRCQVISFFGGAEFKVYKYRRYDDVRLVFSPEFAASFFGGDEDNFSFPRYDLDCAFVRLYDHGKPAATPAALTWSSAPPTAGEPVIVSGNPGMTERGDTVAQLENERDLVLPAALALHQAARDRLIAFSARGAEDRRLAAYQLFEEENLIKVIAGRLAVLRDPAFMAARSADETALRAKVVADPKLAVEVGDPWARVGDALTGSGPEFHAWELLENGAGGGSRLYAWARILVRSATERLKPSGQRLPEFADSRLPLLRDAVLERAPVSAPLEAALLGAWLDQARARLGPASAATADLLRGEAPDALARNLAAGSSLADPEERRTLWDGGLPAIEASDDPMIVFVRRTDPLARAARTAFENDVEGPIQRGEEIIAQARFATGGEAYPNANFSLRLSWGHVLGWRENGAAVPPFTTLAELYAHGAAAQPYEIAPRWQAARRRLDPATVLDFVTTNDITGGNSGSPVVDVRGDLVGTAFDGNRASIAGAFVYNPAANRTVALSTAAITAALSKVYGRTALLAELGVR